MRAVEFRCELRDAGLARLILPRAGAVHVGTVEAEDTHFRVPDGALKRRAAPGEPTDWVWYRRPGGIAPRVATFDIYADSFGREHFGARPMSAWVAVRKQRDMWLAGNLSVYLDTVEGLGSFVKLEMIVSTNEGLSKCDEAIAAMRAELQPALGEPISMGYAELLSRELLEDGSVT